MSTAAASIQPGTCRYCSCTEERPCNTPPSGEPCNWINAERTICSGRDCIIRAGEDDMRRRRLEFHSMTDYLRGGVNRRKRKKKGKAA